MKTVKKVYLMFTRPKESLSSLPLPVPAWMIFIAKYLPHIISLIVVIFISLLTQLK